ncbi:hypothetical protein NT6N_04560 [Oceaniferula spumae]|uniref:Tyr recombinase domain-containing protein n=1 Tax=Oceaniferula spumae TaxID=2979115 RepID=A0AAT9FHF7_9BACT
MVRKKPLTGRAPVAFMLALMATLFKRNNSPYWQTAYIDRRGDRLYRSTGKLKKTDARAVAAKWELEEKKGKVHELSLQTELAEIVARAAVDANKGSLTVDKARSYVMQLFEISNHEELPGYSLEGWLDKWLEDKAPSLKLKTLTRYKSSIRAVKKALGKNARLPLELFSTQHAKALRDKLDKTKGAARNATVNVKLTDFKAAMTTAHDEGLTERNVGRAIRNLPEDDSKLVTHFEPKEVQILIDGTKKTDWKAVILIAATTGLRLSDIVGMKWSSVHLDKQCLVVSPEKQRKGKVKKTVNVPINEGVIKLLNLQGVKKSGYVFPNLSGKTTATHSTNFNNLMSGTGVPKTVTLDNGQEASRSFHSLRHSFAVWLRNADVERDVRKSLMAHSSDKVHEIYAKHDAAALRKATSKLPEFDITAP